MPTYATHTARHGKRVLKFQGCVLGVASSRRPDSPRWSELVVYGIDNGAYVRSKVGYSLIAHRDTCPLADPRMHRWRELLDDREEIESSRVPCVVCQPSIGTGIDPDTLLESTRYTATVARSASDLAVLLLAKAGNRPGIPQLVQTVIDQVCFADPAFATYWATVSPVGVKATG